MILESVAFCELDKRTILTIPNPFLEGIDTSYEQYLYIPAINQWTTATGKNNF